MNYFEENEKFLGLNGVIGRRGFIINCIIIEIFEALVCTTPLLYILLKNPNLVSGFSASSSPIWYTQWLAIVGLASSLFYFSSFIRRVRDILGTEDDNKINLIAGILTVLNFVSYLPIGGYIGKILGLTIIIYLAITTGSITGSKPKSEVIKFNWGAFFGTWMWGLFNKSYITLLMIPLIFTTAGFPFMLLCGLKGNEWAYKNKNDIYIEKFHQSQKNQTIIWIILTPVLNLFLTILLTIGAGFGISKYISDKPELKTKIINGFKGYQQKAVESTFDKIEVQNGIYKFYAEPEDWAELSDTLKLSQIKNAELYALIKENKNIGRNADFVTSVEVLNRIKICSTFNNEVLAEYYMNIDEAKKLSQEYKEQKISVTEVREALKKGYKLNNNPSLP